MRTNIILILSAGLTAVANGQTPLNMQAIAQALGVSCDYCHLAERGSGQPEPKKDIARAMIAMTRDINAKIQAAAPGSNIQQVECVTCHRGVPVPRQLSDILSQTLKTQGAAAAIDQYRELRKQFYGRQAYDFGENTLIGVAQKITSSRPSDSIALLQLNLEFFPRSAASYAEIGFAYTRQLDDDSAIANLEKALEIEPGNGVIRGQLEQLKSYQRARQRRE
ncbi:MAG TPA: photosynthetic reaction center cytochrome c subunit family protein [Bryobacteraceae bacterium]|jgi:tetratricopeptide (TPR) repeat protein